MSDVLHDVVLPLLENVRHSGNGYTARCPAHDDNQPSLSVSVGEKQPVAFYCQAGCDQDDVLTALNLTWADLCAPKERQERSVVVAQYEYKDEQGIILFVKVRMQPKDFRVKRPDGKGSWVWSLGSTRRVLYRLPEVLAAINDGRTIYLVEGEKDVHAAEKAGVVATCNFDGASKQASKPKWRPEYGDTLKGAHVVIVADNDDAGRAHARAAAKDLNGKAASVRIVRGLVDQEHADLTDHLAAGHGIDDLIPLDSGEPSEADQAESGESWDEPLPFDWPTSLPGWPADVFPPVPAAFVAALAEETQTPTDFVGVTVLGILSACVGGRVMVRCPTWVEPTNMFVVAVLPPGSRKSAVIASCRAPLGVAEQTLIEELADEIRNKRTEREIRDQYAEQCKRIAAKEPTPASISAAQEAERDAAAVTVREHPRLVTSDATPEAMVSLLATQGGRIAAISAEAGMFASLTGRYAKNPNLDPVLQAHAGDEILVDRRSRAPERIARPALTMLASIQPYALRDMTGRADFAGRGLLARGLWSLPPDLVGKRKIRNVQPVSQSVQFDFNFLIENLATSMFRRTGTVTLTLSEGATETLLTYAEKVEKLLRPEGDLGRDRMTREWGSKLVGAVARIAGCLHAARGENFLGEQIEDSTMRSAVAIGEYFRAHAVAALAPRGDDARTGNLQYVLTKVVEMGGDEFTTRALHRKVQRRFTKAGQLLEILDELADLGWLRKVEKGFVPHPDAKVMLDQANNPGDSGDSGDNADVPAGQDPYSPVPGTVTTPGDSGDNLDHGQGHHPETVTTVTGGGDTLHVEPEQPVSWENTPSVTTVTTVTGVERSLAGDSGNADVEWSA